jgi:hypothetical protein
MTKKECAIVMAYTGITMLSGEDFSIYHRYIEAIMGRPVWTHELADNKVIEEIKKKSRYDFLKLCQKAKESDDSRRKQLRDLYDQFVRDTWSEAEDVRGNNMIQIKTARQILSDLLCELGVWDEGEEPEA